MKRPTKSELRAQLAAETEAYLANGGEVVEVPRGATALENGKMLHTSPFQPSETPQQRTPAGDALAAIDARKKAKRPEKPKHRSRAPKKQVIYDDFGEPLRVVWIQPEE